ncbi:aconitase family protein, partial [Enterobacter hormaechei]|uniref:aconitase family protein n=1 Tax=Enterobacter hormaechei TaxID=158836 RepID=UPI0021E013E7
YMGLNAGQSTSDIKVNYVFIGSCTNARIEDFRSAADYVKGKHKAENIVAWLVPGSQQVAKQIYDEGLGKGFNEAGFQIHQPGCSACLAMNEDKIPEGEYCVSTSNRNFEGRQGQGARTLLASPLTAAKVAVEGRIPAFENLN